MLWDKVLKFQHKDLQGLGGFERFVRGEEGVGEGVKVESRRKFWVI